MAIRVNMAANTRAVSYWPRPTVRGGAPDFRALVSADIPGLDASKIEVTLDRGVLRLAGERTSGIPANDPAVHVYTRERGSGSFARAISLPDDVDPAQVNASYRDGVLQVSVARRESAQPKRITVQ